MAKVELKQPIVDEISANIKDAASVVLVSSRGLTVAQDTEMRKELREAGVIFKVYKNTMMKRAFEGTECESLNDYLNGPSALAISKDDVTAPARILNKYVNEIEPMVFKAGMAEGKFCDLDEIIALASIPSREELLSKLLGSLQSPITNFARVIKQVAEKGGESAEAPAEEAKAEETAPAEEAKAEDAAPAEEAKAEDAAPAEEAKAEESAPAEEAKAEDAAPAEEPKAEEAAPAEEPKAEEAAPAEEEKAEESAE